MTNWRTTSPRIAALYALEQRFGESDVAMPELAVDAEPGNAWKLAEWQAEGVARAEWIIGRRGGVLIADSVGLGKTHIGAALVKRASARGLRCMVIVPTSLRAHWQRTLLHRNAPGQTPAGPRIVTHAQLSRSHGPALVADAQFIVVDEAHAFRSRHTRRYRALRTVRGRAGVVLLTATPVNNSSADLLNLLLLFARDDAFRDIGVPGLTSVFRAGDTAAVTRVLAETTIRRTRSFVRRNYDTIVDARGQTLRFPDREDPITICYDLADVYGDAWPNALEAIRDLELVWLNAGTRELLRLNLLKRLESGVHAFVTSVESLRGFTDVLLDALRSGRFLSPAEYRRFFSGLTDQLVMRDVMLRADNNRSIDREAICRDRARARELLQTLALDEDPKLDALRDVLRREAATAPVLVFTSFRDTARHLWRSLRNQFRTALIDGEDARLGAARTSRASILRALAPGARVHERERIDVLIATDVLSEGLGLHAARTVVSYDLPWNPIRIVQRVGRIDRPGSPHATIRIINFIPERGLDRLLDLLHRIRTKLDTIRTTIGLEAPVLDRSDVDADALRAVLDRLATGGDARVLDGESDDVFHVTEQLHHDWKLSRRDLERSCGESNVVAGVPGHMSVLARDDRLLVIRDGAVTEDVLAAFRILRDALADPLLRDVDPRCVQRALVVTDASCAASAAVTRVSGPAAQASRLLLAGASRLGGPLDLVRVEAVIRQLRARLSPAAEFALDRLVSDPPSRPEELLEQVESTVAAVSLEAPPKPWVLLLGRGSELG